MEKGLMALALCLLAGRAAVCAEPSRDAAADDGGRTVRLVTYNVGVFNKYVRDDYRLVAGLLREVRPDAVCLNELDSCTARTRGVFQLERIAGMMGGWDFRFGAAMPFDGGSYGEGVMTRERAVRKEAVALPEAGGAEPRVLVVVELPDYVIATTHLDHVSPEAQLEQVRTINREMMRRYGDSPKPVFLGGDLNAEPGSETLRLLERTWRVCGGKNEM